MLQAAADSKASQQYRVQQELTSTVQGTTKCQDKQCCNAINSKQVAMYHLPVCNSFSNSKQHTRNDLPEQSHHERLHLHSTSW